MSDRESRKESSVSVDVQMGLSFESRERGATLSDCGLYRYSLWRRWDYTEPSVLFVMLNPSTADAGNDDPTIRKCIGFAKRWGLGGIRVVNLYAYRATYPRDLTEAVGAGIDPVAASQRWARNANDAAITSAASDAARIIAAWGAWTGPFDLRVSRVQRLLAGRHVEALKLTKHGHPWHPLMARYDLEPLTYWSGGERLAA